MSAASMSGRGDRLVRLQDSERILSKGECAAIQKRLAGFARGGGETGGAVSSYWMGGLRWAGNDVTLAADRRDIMLMVSRRIDDRTGYAYTNQLDDASLEAAVRAAERGLTLFGTRVQRDFTIPAPAFTYPTPAIWSDATYGVMTRARAAVAQEFIEPAEAQGMRSAGYLEVRATGSAVLRDEGDLLYAACTQAQCSTTVRDAQGTGSGWAGLSSYDWAAIDPKALAARALEKAVASRNPVAIEPGRYTVILEPQAVHDLVALLMGAIDRERAELGGGTFSAGVDPTLTLPTGEQVRYTKLGLEVIDERITIDHDPMDPRLGILPMVVAGDYPPQRAVTWIDHGVLTTLAYTRRYALARLTRDANADPRGAFRMSGGETSVEEMIATTKRGLLVTRLSNIRILDPISLLATGLTRDGLWLVENGKISKAVKNLRFTESPLFALNSVEQLGVPVPVFRPAGQPFEDPGVTPAIVPPLKVRDFSFTSTIDAI
jgi:predicted Zn-dependent protease